MTAMRRIADADVSAGTRERAKQVLTALHALHGELFVVVWVDYDWFRFQSNFGASITIEGAREIARDAAEKKPYADLPIIEDRERSFGMDTSEERHIWIDAWGVDSPLDGVSVFWDTAEDEIELKLDGFTVTVSEGAE